MRIGLFGGSFDPPHLGHLILADQCLSQQKLDYILFIPTYQAPHKKENPQIDRVQHRLEMLRLALENHPQFQIYLGEIQRQGLSYTYHTLCDLQQQYPHDQLFFIIGADSLFDLPSWYKSAELFEKTQFITVNREPYTPEDLLQSIQKLPSSYQHSLLQNLVKIPSIGISSRLIRQFLQEKRSIHYLVPQEVENYIATHQLYNEVSLKQKF